MSVNVLIEPKPITSLVNLWDYMFEKQATLWQYMGSAPTDLKPALDELMGLGGSSWKSDDVRLEFECFSPFPSPFNDFHCIGCPPSLQKHLWLTNSRFALWSASFLQLPCLPTPILYLEPRISLFTGFCHETADRIALV